MSSQRAEQLLEAATWLQAKGDVEGARRLCEQALRMEPANERARRLLNATGAGPSNAGPSRPPGLPAIPTPPAPASAAPPRDAAAMEAGFGESWFGGTDGESSGEPWSPAHRPPGGVGARSRPGGSPPALDPLDLLSRDALADAAEAREEAGILLAGVRDLLELDDHSGALDLLLRAEALAPGHPEARLLRERSEAILESMFESRLGALEATPKVLLEQDEIIWLNLDHRAGFVLAQIDGTVTFSDVFELSGMSRLDTARILAQLCEQGVISGGTSDDPGAGRR